MTQRLSQIEERIVSVGQLSSVVAAIRGIAASRLREGEQRLDGVRAYAEAVGLAIGEALALVAGDGTAGTQDLAPSGGALVIALCSEQGFVGRYNSQVLEVADRLVRERQAELIVVGDHGLMVVEERGMRVSWSLPMATHAEEANGLANRLADALYDRVRAGVVSAVVVHASPDARSRLEIVEKHLIPFDFSRFATGNGENPPLLTMAPQDLLMQLAEEYVFAELCEAAIMAFAAENEARMRAMISAHDNVAHRLEDLESLARRKRQEEITSEVVELAAGIGADMGKHQAPNRA